MLMAGFTVTWCVSSFFFGCCKWIPVFFSHTPFCREWVSVSLYHGWVGPLFLYLHFQFKTPWSKLPTKKKHVFISEFNLGPSQKIVNKMIGTKVRIIEGKLLQNDQLFWRNNIRSCKREVHRQIDLLIRTQTALQTRCCSEHEWHLFVAKTSTRVQMAHYNQTRQISGRSEESGEFCIKSGLRQDCVSSLGNFVPYCNYWWGIDDVM